MYDKVATDLDFAQRESVVASFWKEHGIVRKSLELRKGGPRFTFFDGPPTANGRPHIGHVITRAVKDVIPRYWSMKGYDVMRKAGWDTHGLPVELEVEKQLGIDGKAQIEAYGIEPFIGKCKESVWKYKSQWEDMSERVAFWADMADPYVTYENKYIESVWWSLRQIWDKGLLYKGHKVVPYCPRCGTALSSHEVAQGYKDVSEQALFVKFQIAGAPGEYIVAWTTTPWTLPSNVGLAVHPDHIYAKVEWRGERYILAKELVGAVFGAVCGVCASAGAGAGATADAAPGKTGAAAESAEPADAADASDASDAADASDAPRILAEFPGNSLTGLAYEPLFGFSRAAVGAAVPDGSKTAWTVCADSFVTLEEGSGVVHMAPAFGEDDARVGRDYGLPFIQLVDPRGRFVEAAEPWNGMFVKDADPLIIEHLRSRGLLLRAHAHEHTYPFCWRCDTPLLYYARDAWFIRMTAVRESLLRNNDSINWYPDNVRRGRFGNFLENVVDWGLSRERYWGTPLPIWECGGCGHRHLVGSIQELREMGEAVSAADGSRSPVPEGIELHKPHIDAVRLRCPRCGAHMSRVPEVIDCWYDAGSMPFAQWHYPFENRGGFSERFPADFISEAIDQTRGWFYTLLAISTLLFDAAPFKNCIVMGHVLDKDGIKMSKHKGNVIDPWDALDRNGADAVRWHFFVGSAPWLPSRFSLGAVDEVQRKFLGTLWNTYAFYVLYAEIDQFDPAAHAPLECAGGTGTGAGAGATVDNNDDNDNDNDGANESAGAGLGLMDRWALSRLNSLIASVDRDLAAYKITEPARAIAAFVDDLSNWYVRRCRSRYWADGMGRDKERAYLVLHTALVALAKLCAPFVPYVSELIYQNLVNNPGLASGRDPTTQESVHLCDFPSADPSLVDGKLEEDMGAALAAVQLGRACRNAAGIKNRQPLPRLVIVGGKSFGADFGRIIADELNVKEVEFASDPGRFTSYRFKPQLKALGPRYGRLVPKIAGWLAGLDGDEAMAVLGAGGSLRCAIDGVDVSLSRDDVLIETARKSHFVTESADGVTVALDTSLTDALVEEGYVRELVSKIQTMRREAGFEVQDHIQLGIVGSSLVSEILSRNYETIADETLTDALIEARAGSGADGITGSGAGGGTGSGAGEGTGSGAPFAEGCYTKEWKINAETVSIAVRKTSRH